MAVKQLSTKIKRPSIVAEHLKILLLMVFGGPLFGIVLLVYSLFLMRDKSNAWFTEQPGYLQHIRYLPAFDSETKKSLIFRLSFYFALPLLLIWWVTMWAFLAEMFVFTIPFLLPLLLFVVVLSLMWLRGKYMFFRNTIIYDWAEPSQEEVLSQKKSSNTFVQNLKYFFVFVGFGPVLALILPFAISVLFNDKARRWFRRQPGYLYFLSYLPGLGRTSKRGMVLGLLFYFAAPLIIFWLVIGLGLLFIDRLMFAGDAYDFVGILIMVLPLFLVGSIPIAWLSGWLGYSWLTGKMGFFQKELLAEKMANNNATLSGNTPAVRRANLRSFLGISNLETLRKHDQRSALMTHYLSNLPRFIWWLVFLVGVPSIVLVYLSTGWVFGFGGAVFSFVPRYRKWLQNQPGTINRLGLLRGWQSERPFILALAHFIYFGILPGFVTTLSLVSLFSDLENEDFGLWVFFVLGIIIAPYISPLFLGWLVRGWNFPLPGINSVMWVFRGIRRWRRDLKTAVSLHDDEEFNEAIALLKETEAFCEQRFGERHFTRSGTLNAMGRNYLKLGDYLKATTCFTQVVLISENGFGKVSYQTAKSQYRLGKLHVHLGHFTKAIPVFKQSIRTFHLLGAENNRAYGKALNDLGYAYLNLNHLEIAQALFEEAESIQKDQFVEEWTDTVNHLALLFTEKGEFEEADKYFQLLEQNEASVPRQVKSWYWFNRASYYRKVEQFETALNWQVRALENEQSLYYDTHLTIGKYQKQLADIFLELGEYDKALNHYTDAKGIYYLHNELTHPEFLDCLFGSAKLHTATGNYKAAFADMKMALDNEEEIVGRILAFGSENGRLAFIKAKYDRMMLLLELIRQHLADSPEALEATSIILRRQSLIADVSSAAKSLHSDPDPQTKKIIRQLESLNREIGFFESDGSRKDESEVVFNRKRIEKYAERERLETELSRRLPFKQILAKINEATWPAIQQALPPKSVLLQLVYGRRYDFTAVPAKNQPNWSDSGYMLFALRKDASQPTLVDLGPGEPVENAIKSLRRLIDSMRKKGAATPSESDKQAYFEAGQRLIQLILSPIDHFLDGKEHLFIVPDGMFSSLPFEILPTGKDKYLLEKYQISYLSAARDLLRDYHIHEQSEPLVIANPDYNLFKNTISAAGEVSTRDVDLTEAETRAFFDEFAVEENEQLGELVEAAPFLSRDFNHRGAVYFSDLANTYEEGETIGELLDVEPKMKAEANEYQIKNISSPKLLHIATHGFFLEQKEPGEKSVNHRLLKMRENPNPLVRAGLALAGANRWLRNEKQRTYQENGILNGLDVASLDLTSTKLVVLSACDTGLGDFVDGEGVFGLRRAFVMAGAHTLVMSMWKVPDAQTKQLMIEFYKNLLDGVPRAKALREAQLSIRQNEETSHPFFWGAFICQGAFTPLDEE